tara:strand:+ start:546 stop:779 length:234 start_codon:yes stop_codon:yes gene_type:complete
VQNAKHLGINWEFFDLIRLMLAPRRVLREKLIPNITPDKETGIGGWSRDDLMHALQTVMSPNGDFLGNLMRIEVENY